MCRVMFHFIGSILSIAILKLSIEISSNPLIEVCTHCTQLLSKICVRQHCKALINVYHICKSFEQ